MDPPGPGDHLALHFSMNGSALFKDSDEARQQVAYQEKKKCVAAHLNVERSHICLALVAYCTELYCRPQAAARCSVLGLRSTAQ
jgi:hypothetical protein